MRITITCEGCGQRHQLARTRFEPGPIWLVCHGCERSLQAQLGSWAAGTEDPGEAAPAPLLTSFDAAWGGTIDLGIGAA